jgi:hypothetical protein
MDITDFLSTRMIIIVRVEKTPLDIFEIKNYQLIITRSTKFQTYKIIRRFVACNFAFQVAIS